MIVIRFFRVGKKNQPCFKIVVTDKKKPSRAGRFVEEVGFYNPITKERVLKGERIKYWLSVGAKPSSTVFNLLVSEKIIVGKKINVHKKPKKGKEPTPAKTTESKEPVTIKTTEDKKEKPKEEKIEEKTQETPKKETPEK